MLLISVCLLCTFSLAEATCFKDNPVGVIIQLPKYILTHPGGSVNITCSVPSQKDIVGIYLMKRFHNIMYMNSKSEYHTENDYSSRLHVSGTVIDFTVTLRNVSVNDTDLYLCDGAKQDMGENMGDLCGGGTVVIVHPHALCIHDEKSQGIEQRYVFTAVIIAIILMCMMFTSLFFIRKIYRKRKCQSHGSQLPQNTVYEDMTRSIRRNTMANANCYTSS